MACSSCPRNCARKASDGEHSDAPSRETVSGVALGYMIQLTIGPVAFASRNMAAAQSTCFVHAVQQPSLPSFTHDAATASAA